VPHFVSTLEVVKEMKKLAILLSLSSMCFGSPQELSTFQPEIKESIRGYRITEIAGDTITTGELRLETELDGDRIIFKDDYTFKGYAQEYRIAYDSNLLSSPSTISITTEHGRDKGTTVAQIENGTAIARFEGDSMEFPYPQNTLNELALFRLVEAIPDSNWGPYLIKDYNPIGSITVMSSSDAEPSVIYSKKRKAKLNLSGTDVPFRETTFVRKTEYSDTIKFHFWVSDERVLEKALMQKIDSKGGIDFSRIYERIHNQAGDDNSE